MGLDMYLMAERPTFGLTTNGRDEEHVGGYDFLSESERARYQQAITAAGLDQIADKGSPNAEIVPGPSVSVIATVGYWRKANQIHHWFVEKIQHGRDECQRSEVTRDQLAELRDACLLVLGSTSLQPGQVTKGYRILDGGIKQPMLEDGAILTDTRIAMDVLPTCEGFFFGGTGYDQGYFADLQQTVETIDRALTAPSGTRFYYQASW